MSDKDMRTGKPLDERGWPMDEKSDDIVARLRDPGAYIVDYKDSMKMCADAADAIERKDAEIERLAERCAILIAEKRNRDAEIAKLRTVLQEILQLVAEKAHGPIGVIARRALNPEE